MTCSPLPPNSTLLTQQGDVLVWRLDKPAASTPLPAAAGARPQERSDSRARGGHSAAGTSSAPAAAASQADSCSAVSSTPAAAASQALSRSGSEGGSDAEGSSVFRRLGVERFTDAGGSPGLGPLQLQLRTCQLPAGEREVQVTAVQGFLRQGSHQLMTAAVLGSTADTGEVRCRPQGAALPGPAHAVLTISARARSHAWAAGMLGGRCSVAIEPACSRRVLQAPRTKGKPQAGSLHGEKGASPASKARKVGLHAWATQQRRQWRLDSVDSGSGCGALPSKPASRRYLSPCTPGAGGGGSSGARHGTAR